MSMASSVFFEIDPAAPATDAVKALLEVVRANPNGTELQISIRGYDADSRELWDIPEARSHLLHVIDGVAAKRDRWWSRAKPERQTALLIGLCRGHARYAGGQADDEDDEPAADRCIDLQATRTPQNGEKLAVSQLGSMTNTHWRLVSL
jgi:hypothetical protein